MNSLRNYRVTVAYEDPLGLRREESIDVEAFTAADAATIVQTHYSRWKPRRELVQITCLPGQREMHRREAVPPRELHTAEEDGVVLTWDEAELRRLRDRVRALEQERDRLFDLVRHQRGELLDADLITREEYSRLLVDGGTHKAGSVARLHSYDQMRSELAALRAERDRLRELLKDFVEDLEARWDISDPHTNPGIRDNVQRARVVLAEGQPKP